VIESVKEAQRRGRHSLFGRRVIPRLVRQRAAGRLPNR
jgi:hypothetical protein